MTIKVIKSNRKSISIEIKPDLTVIVRAPLRMPDSAIIEFVNEKSDWIAKNLEVVKRKTMEKEANQKEPFSEAEIKSFTAKAKAIIPSRVELYAKIMGLKYGRITIRHQVSRWGSCSAKGNLNFNCLLLLCPEEVRDYVIIHELCHLKELNHSHKFWAEVERYCPDYKACKNWLKQNGGEMINRIR